ncbi:hypothetical protein ZEAMMB73_Zm00001d029230, partial [Zea mays]
MEDALSQDPHVVRLLDLKQGVNKEGQTILYLIFEYMDTDLKKFIRGYHANHEKIPAQTVKILMYQLCKGVSFVHGRGVLHRDLKPHNLLMDRKTMALKIADLGLSRAITVPVKKYTHEILTLWYRAPEVLLGATHYSTPVDIWLLGTPNEEMWPGVGKLPNWHVYPQWKPTELSTLVP